MNLTYNGYNSFKFCLIWIVLQYIYNYVELKLKIKSIFKYISHDVIHNCTNHKIIEEKLLLRISTWGINLVTLYRKTNYKYGISFINRGMYIVRFFIRRYLLSNKFKSKGKTILLHIHVPIW